MPLEYIDYCAALNLLEAAGWQPFTTQRSARWFRKNIRDAIFERTFILRTSENGNSATLFRTVPRGPAWEGYTENVPNLPDGWTASVLAQGTLDEVLMSLQFTRICV